MRDPVITTEHECETGCCRPAPTTRMCWDCVQDILDALDTVTDDHLRTLTLITRGEEKPFTLRTHSNTLRVHGPSEPLNLTALSLLQDLTAWAQITPADWANTSRPGHWHHYVLHRCQLAVDMVDGETEDKPTTDYLRHRLKGQALPMPTRRLVPWLRDLGFKVTSSQISTWANRGKIARVDSGPGHPFYSPVDVVRVLNQTRG